MNEALQEDFRVGGFSMRDIQNTAARDALKQAADEMPTETIGEATASIWLRQYAEHWGQDCNCPPLVGGADE